jgi:hypothetical protein
MSSMFRRYGRLLLVVALLVAQQGALAHDILHAVAGVPAHERAAAPGQSHGNQSQGSPLHKFHDALGTVLGGLNCVTALLQLADVQPAYFPATDFPAPSIAAPPPASRGPPVLL